ncbi:hypothetical protein ACIRPX_29855 [Streptomyces sp. NPDC101225]|uniref:hypothetical protein n=1 Tax=Streptomyces sp. NPDC101225 TaxID=3366135 RepID=UPI003829CE5B
MPTPCLISGNSTTTSGKTTASQPTDDALAPHPDTLDIIRNRRTKRGQLNHAVPEVLQLQRRIRRYNADTDLPHGDIVALALDTWLRAKGYPPGPGLDRVGNAMTGQHDQLRSTRSSGSSLR